MPIIPNPIRPNAIMTNAITPNGHYTECSLHRIPITPKSHWTEYSLHRISLHRIVIIPNAHYTEYSLHRNPIRPNIQYTESMCEHQVYKNNCLYVFILQISICVLQINGEGVVHNNWGSSKNGSLEQAKIKDFLPEREKHAKKLL